MIKEIRRYAGLRRAEARICRNATTWTSAPCRHRPSSRHRPLLPRRRHRRPSARGAWMSRHGATTGGSGNRMVVRTLTHWAKARARDQHLQEHATTTDCRGAVRGTAPSWARNSKAPAATVASMGTAP
eukprot:4594746-Alexandrium_andersonii.AAC.1